MKQSVDPEYKIVTSPTVMFSLLASLALENRLYVNGWCLKGDLQNAMQMSILTPVDDAPPSISLAFVEGKPVGVCLTYRGGVQIFVRKKFRKKGIGRALFKSVETWNDMRMEDGIKGSQIFWEKMRNNS